MSFTGFGRAPLTNASGQVFIGYGADGKAVYEDSQVRNSQGYNMFSADEVSRDLLVAQSTNQPVRSTFAGTIQQLGLSLSDAASAATPNPTSNQTNPIPAISVFAGLAILYFIVRK